MRSAAWSLGTSVSYFAHRSKNVTPVNILMTFPSTRPLYTSPLRVFPKPGISSNPSLMIQADGQPIIDPKVVLAAEILSYLHFEENHDGPPDTSVLSNWASQLDLDDVLEKAKLVELEMNPPATSEQLWGAAKWFSLLVKDDEPSTEAAGVEPSPVE